ncbi:lysylphosphatidylglycerol synthase transmembrane domain-containing protein [Parasegetibacter sp. NRK P23]|uniref:lysylphosphatidylglycerol synthase transmembrane domain-containing protein n=1 Tax=Parasegetibacter sp. NRK P23 TaxID=2942999 RepID=UPI002044B2F8|nr:lysylphosphatidylglycerol synthase transmembrane domain-containing protein [Parasegetibacter sp. NRK P23]MCM5530093.1 flippase-like domain-containing protein [Parasegetibacter sp. NRK P23]
MNKKLRSLLQYIIFLGLGIFLIWLTTRGLDEAQVEQLKSSLSGARYWLLVPVLLALLVSHWSRAVRWKILMQPLGYQPRTSNTFLAVMVGYLANLAVPRLGEVLKCTLLARYEKVPADKLIGTIVAERAFDMICLLIVFALTIFTQVDTIGAFAQEQLNIAGAGASIGVKLLILAVVGGAAFFVGKFLLKKFSHIGIVQKINAVVKGIWQGLTSVRFVKKKGLFFFHTFFIWFLYLMSIRVGFYAMESTENLGIPEALSILSFGSIAMIVTQGGIGAYQFLIQKVMVVYKLNEVEGLAFGWLLWGAQTFIILLAGLVCLGLLPYINRSNKPAVQTDPASGDRLN